MAPEEERCPGSPGGGHQCPVNLGCFTYLSDKEKIRKSALIIDTRTAGVFVPKSKYNELLKNIDEDVMELLLI